MKENFQQALKEILRSEGGFVNHPSDPGGMTNLGVTKRTWEEWVKRTVDEAEMRCLTPAAVEPLYKAMYWDKINGDALPDGLDYCVFDAAVNMGIHRASVMLQLCLGLKPDGIIGQQTLGLIKQEDPAKLIDEYSDRRSAAYQEISTFPIFGKGWIRRVNSVETIAKAMQSGSSSSSSA